MKTVSLQGVGGEARAWLHELRRHRFFADRLSLTIMAINLILVGVTLLVLLVRVRPSAVPVPVHYSSLVGFDRLGPWWRLYSIGLFSLMVMAVNTALALVSFTRSRITSFFLLAGAFVVAIFSLIVSLAITAVV